MRAHGPLIWLPGAAGTAIHWPCTFARYSISGETAPFAASSGFITSSSGSRSRALSAGCQVGNASRSCPAFACDSAAMVIRFLLPCDGM